MTCKTVRLPGGVTAIVCTRGRRKREPPCGVPGCGRESTKLCDFPLRGRLAGKTCDLRLCSPCASDRGPDLDYCPAHARLVDR